MPTYQLLTDRTLAQSSAITPTTLIHIVYTGDPSQNPAGSSYKAELGQLTSLYSGSTQLIVKNTVYVSKNGNNSTGLVERLDKPFLTINAGLNAIRAAYPDTGRTPTNRVKVVVEDGYYSEASFVFLYPYIDFDLGNSVVNVMFTDSTMVATYSANPNKDFTTKIFGNAKLYAQTNPQCIVVTNQNTRLLVECDTITSENDDAIAMVNGYCRVICNLIMNSRPSANIFCHAIEMLNNNSNPCVLDIVNATITQSSTSNQASPIHFGNALGGVGVFNQTLNLYNCRVINTNSGVNSGYTSAITVGITHNEPSGSTLNLYNTVVYSKFGHSIFVSNTFTPAHLDVYYYNFNSLNNTPFIATIDANHTLNEYITTGRNVDSNVIPRVF